MNNWSTRFISGFKEKFFTKFSSLASSLASIPNDATQNRFFRSVYHFLMKGQIQFYEQNPSVYIDKGYKINPHVHSVVKYIARSVSSVPFYLYEVKDAKAYNRFKSYQQKGEHEMAEIYAEKAMKIVEGHQLNELLANPNPYQSFSEFIFESVGFKMLTGNNFLYGLVPAGFEDQKTITQLYNMPSQLVQIVEGSWLLPVSGYKLSIGKQDMELSTEEVAHRKEWNPDDNGTGQSLYGLSPLSALLKTVQRSNES